MPLQDSRRSEFGEDIVEQTANRRKTSRHRLNCPVRIRERGVEAALNAIVSDISLDGCYVETLQPFPMGTPLELTLTPPQGAIRVCGSVCSVHLRTGMGVSFSEMDDENRQRLSRLVTMQKERGVGESF